jgi:hypothetical protein
MDQPTKENEMTEIKNRYTGRVLLTVNADCLRDANLQGADLRDADLHGADLRDANLHGADLWGANLLDADLLDADLSPEQTAELQHVPVTEEFTGYKRLVNGVIAELLIPADAQRLTSLTSRKCRASRAVVVSLSGGVTSAVGTYNKTTVYTVGETVTPDSYDADPRVECSHGIHFFTTRDEAEQY